MRLAAPVALSGCGTLLRMSDIRAISSRQAIFGRMSGGGNRWHGVHAARASASVAVSTAVCRRIRNNPDTDAALGTVPKVSRISNTTRGRRIQSMLAHYRVALLLNRRFSHTSIQSAWVADGPPVSKLPTTMSTSPS